jgi:hypothetical protein
MNKRLTPTLGLLIALAPQHPSVAQSPSSTQREFPHKEIVLAKSSFIDIGPPFDFYSIYLLTSSVTGTDVEKIAITPPASSCLQPTTEVSHTHLQQTLGELFDGKDLCSIPEKALRREAKRCKNCLIFSGVHITAEVQCHGKPRLIRYEVLDRDMFDAHPGTPQGTSRTMKLMSTLDEAFGGGDLDRPIFSSASGEAQGSPNSDSLKEVESGKYDSLFSESVSQLYRDSQLPQKRPLVAIESSSPSTPISPALPPYPPIARAAHVGGRVSLQLQVGSDGKVSDVKWISGPMMLQAVSVDTAQKWLFPNAAADQTQSVVLDFNINCPDITTTSPAKSH